REDEPDKEDVLQEDQDEYVRRRRDPHRGELDDQAQHREGDEVIHQSDGNDRASEPAVQQVQVEQDSDAYRERRDGEGGPEEERLGEGQTKRLTEAVAEGEGQEKLDEGDDHASLLERLTEPAEAEFDPREHHQDEDSEVRDDGKR